MDGFSGYSERQRLGEEAETLMAETFELHNQFHVETSRRLDRMREILRKIQAYDVPLDESKTGSFLEMVVMRGAVRKMHETETHSALYRAHEFTRWREFKAMGLKTDGARRVLDALVKKGVVKRDIPFGKTRSATYRIFLADAEPYLTVLGTQAERVAASVPQLSPRAAPAVWTAPQVQFPAVQFPALQAPSQLEPAVDDYEAQMAKFPPAAQAAAATLGFRYPIRKRWYDTTLGLNPFVWWEADEGDSIDVGSLDWPKPPYVTVDMYGSETHELMKAEFIRKHAPADPTCPLPVPYRQPQPAVPVPAISDAVYKAWLAQCDVNIAAAIADNEANQNDQAVTDQDENAVLAARYAAPPMDPVMGARLRAQAGLPPLPPQPPVPAFELAQPHPSPVVASEPPAATQPASPPSDLELARLTDEEAAARLGVPEALPLWANPDFTFRQLNVEELDTLTLEQLDDYEMAFKDHAFQKESADFDERQMPSAG